MPVEKSGQNEFDFQYGDDFGAHIEKFDPDFSKVLVRYNPDDPDTEMNKRQLERLKRLADWLHENDRKFLFELLVPATDAQLEQVGGDTDRYDAELRPELMRRAIEEIQDVGIEVDIWKIEGVDERSDCEMLAKQTRTGEGREGVVCVAARPRRQRRQGRPVAARRRRRSTGFIGFAIGRSIWWDALKGFLDGVARARGGRRADRRQLPALREGLRGGRGGAALPEPEAAAVAGSHRSMRMRQSLAAVRGGLPRGDRRGPRARGAAAARGGAPLARAPARAGVQARRRLRFAAARAGDHRDTTVAGDGRDVPDARRGDALGGVQPSTLALSGACARRARPREPASPRPPLGEVLLDLEVDLFAEDRDRRVAPEIPIRTFSPMIASTDTSMSSPIMMLWLDFLVRTSIEASMH